MRFTTKFLLLEIPMILLFSIFFIVFVVCVGITGAGVFGTVLIEYKSVAVPLTHVRPKCLRPQRYDLLATWHRLPKKRRNQAMTLGCFTVFLLALALSLSPRVSIGGFHEFQAHVLFLCIVLLVADG